MNKVLLYIPRNLGRVLFGVWLIGMGAVPLLSFQSSGTAFLLGLILIGSGICTLIGR